MPAKILIDDGEGSGVRAGVDANHNLKVTVSNPSRPAAVMDGSGGSITGFVATSAATEAAVNDTAFVEQTSGAQRSFSSSSASDTAAGTGARTIQLTYYTYNANSNRIVDGPFTEIITLSGVAAVNTVATNIALVEKIEVVTAGSGGVNAGIISMFAATAGGGGTIASIALGVRRTRYGHHYVASDRICFLTDFYTISTAAAAQFPAFNARSLDYSVANAAEIFIFDNAQQVGSNSRTQTLFYPAPRRISGPARLQFYVVPTNGVAQNNAIDASYFEIPA